MCIIQYYIIHRCEHVRYCTFLIQEDEEDIGKKLDVFSGRFILVSFDDRFDKYLESLGIAKELFGVIKNTSEEVEVVVPKGPDDKWTWTTKSGTDPNTQFDYIT